VEPSTERLVLRPIEPEDLRRLERLFYRLSPTTVYRRFFRPVARPSRRVLDELANVDHQAREAIAALDGDEIVGVARYGRGADGEYELAVVVEDAWQRRGVGRLLMAELTERARRSGIDRFTATVLSENKAVQCFIRALAPDARFSGWGLSADVVIPLGEQAA